MPRGPRDAEGGGSQAVQESVGLGEPFAQEGGSRSVGGPCRAAGSQPPSPGGFVDGHRDRGVCAMSNVRPRGRDTACLCSMIQHASHLLHDTLHAN